MELRSALDGFDEHLVLEGLDQVPKRTERHGFDGGLDGRRSRGQDDGNVEVVCTDDAKQLDAAHLGHLHVRDDDIERM